LKSFLRTSNGTTSSATCTEEFHLPPELQAPSVTSNLEDFPTVRPDDPLESFPTFHPDPTESFPTNRPEPTESFPTIRPDPTESFPTYHPDPTISVTSPAQAGKRYVL
jgi:uracil-DNA glycosylase